MRRVHLVRTALTAALLGVAGLIAAPAAAGGPTSALLSIPGAGSTASLYYTDPEYDELADLVGVSQPSGTFDTELGTHESGPGITITWLIHDVDPWRVDRVYLGSEDGPWISTQLASGNASIWESPVRWHQPEDGARLARLLDGLGLGTAASKNTDFEGVAGASEQDTTPAPTTDPEPAAPSTTEPGWLGRVGWALGGLLAGALLMLAWTRRRTVEQEDAAQPLDGSVEVLAR
jgi:hypothetical protein